jgi:hypothetical protein
MADHTVSTQSAQSSLDRVNQSATRVS